MPTTEYRVDALRHELWALVHEACPSGSVDDTQTALAAVTDVLTALFIGMGTDQLPLVEDICRDLGPEIARQVREAHEGDEDAAAWVVH